VINKFTLNLVYRVIPTLLRRIPCLSLHFRTHYSPPSGQVLGSYCESLENQHEGKVIVN